VGTTDAILPNRNHTQAQVIDNVEPCPAWRSKDVMNVKGTVILRGNAPRTVTDAELINPRIEEAVNRYGRREKPLHNNVQIGIEGIK
jgi:hypothetical protein